MLRLPDGRTCHVASFARGDFFGDITFLDRAARSADAYAETRTWLYVISRERFDALAAARPELGHKIFVELARALAFRLRQTDAQLMEMEDS
jgi:SulP family sulfate permease